MSRINKIRVTFAFDVATFESKSDFAENHLEAIQQRFADKISFYAKEKGFIVGNDIIEFDLGKK